MGPAIVTSDEISDVTKLKLMTKVNGDIRQDSIVERLIFDIPTLISTISKTMTLEICDVIATGTPAGVGIGFDPPIYLKTGDHVEVVIDKIGKLENTVKWDVFQKNIAKTEGVIKKDDKVVGILTGRQKEPLLPIDYHNDPSNKFARPPKI